MPSELMFWLLPESWGISCSRALLFCSKIILLIFLSQIKDFSSFVVIYPQMHWGAMWGLKSQNWHRPSLWNKVQEILLLELLNYVEGEGSPSKDAGFWAAAALYQMIWKHLSKQSACTTVYQVCVSLQVQNNSPFSISLLKYTFTNL